MTTEETAKWELLYDGECSMCIRFAEAVQRFDRKDEVRIIPLQQYSAEHDSPPLEELEQEVHLLSPAGKIFKGGDAIQQLLILIPDVKPLRWMLESKTSSWASKVFYKTISRLRGCRKCGRKKNRHHR